MQRRRLKIGPGGMMYSIVVGLILIVAIYTQANLLYWGFGLMIGGLIVSVLHSVAMMRNLQVQRILPSHGVAGEAMMIRYEIINRKRWVPVFGLVIFETWGKGSHSYKRGRTVNGILRGRPFGWVLHLGTREQVQAEAPCWPMGRGVLQFEKVVLSTSFPFGVVRRMIEFELPAKVLVYPHLWRVSRRILLNLAGREPMGYKRQERAGGQEEFFGLRPYRSGDSLKMIDWKHSAKMAHLVSREHTQPSPPKIMVVLDLTHGTEVQPHLDHPPEAASESIETAVSLAASLVWDAHAQGCRVGLAVIGVPYQVFPIHHSVPHRMQVLRSLAVLDVSRRVLAVPSLPAEPTVVVRTPGANPTLTYGRAIVLRTDRIHEYVSEIKGGAGPMIGRWGEARSRRHERAGRYA